MSWIGEAFGRGKDELAVSQTQQKALEGRKQTGKDALDVWFREVSQFLDRDGQPIDDVARDVEGYGFAAKYGRDFEALKVKNGVIGMRPGFPEVLGSAGYPFTKPYSGEIFSYDAHLCKSWDFALLGIARLYAFGLTRQQLETRGVFFIANTEGYSYAEQTSYVDLLEKPYDAGLRAILAKRIEVEASNGRLDRL